MANQKLTLMGTRKQFRPDRTLSRSALARTMVDDDSDGNEYPSMKQYSALSIHPDYFNSTLATMLAEWVYVLALEGMIRLPYVQLRRTH